MSTTPQGWQQPKTTWNAADAVSSGDFNRTEGNINAIETGSRTVDPAQEPAGNPGTLRQFLDWFANQIAGILGDNWWAAPAITLKAIKAHVDAALSAHPAGAITYAGAPNLSATNVEAALDELDAEKIGRGTTNAGVEQVMAILLPTDTRSLVATTWNASNKPTGLEFRDGANVIVSIVVTYNSDNYPTQIQAVAAGRTITYTINWTGNRFTSYTKAVT